LVTGDIVEVNRNGVWFIETKRR
ncbi:hypothetical protein LCGC14_2758750, partial [marine sediment metagenome]